MDRTEDIKERLARFKGAYGSSYAKMAYPNGAEDVEHLLGVIAELQKATQPSPEPARQTPLTAADLDELEAPVKKWVDEQPESTLMVPYILGRLQHSDVLLSLISMARETLNLVDADEFLKPIYEERDAAWTAADQMRTHINWFSDPYNYRAPEKGEPKVLRDGLARARRAKEASMPGTRYHLPPAALDEIGKLRVALERIALMPLNKGNREKKMQRVACEALGYSDWLQASRNVNARRRQYERLRAFVRGLAEGTDAIAVRAKKALEGKEPIEDPAARLLTVEEAKARMWYAKYYLAICTEKTVKAARKAVEEAKARLEELGLDPQAFVV